ncbi:MAG: hypothetical protein DPW14_06735 [Planctomycetes bacterium]|nr:hypothetical protein [Planctomycetota bacterium]
MQSQSLQSLALPKQRQLKLLENCQTLSRQETLRFLSFLLPACKFATQVIPQFLHGMWKSKVSHD